MRGDAKTFTVLLLALGLAASLVVYSSYYVLLIPALILYIGTSLVLSIYASKTTTKKEAPVVLALSTLATCLGAIAGFLMSLQVSSALTMIGLTLVSATYMLVSIKLREVSS